MNPNNMRGKNYIFISVEGEHRILDFIEAAITLVKEQKVALIFLRRHSDFLTALEGMNKKQMQNLIISYESNIEAVIKKLLELHGWAILPDFVLIDLNAFLDMPQDGTLKSLHLCIATLFSYMRSLEKRKQLKGMNSNSSPTSLVLLNNDKEFRINTIIDFYYYKDTFFNFDAMKCEIIQN